jgi:hypothetical protein
LPVHGHESKFSSEFLHGSVSQTKQDSGGRNGNNSPFIRLTVDPVSYENYQAGVELKVRPTTTIPELKECLGSKWHWGMQPSDQQLIIYRQSLRTSTVLSDVQTVANYDTSVSWSCIEWVCFKCHQSMPHPNKPVDTSVPDHFECATCAQVRQVRQSSHDDAHGAGSDSDGRSASSAHLHGHRELLLELGVEKEVGKKQSAQATGVGSKQLDS